MRRRAAPRSCLLGRGGRPGRLLRVFCELCGCAVGFPLDPPSPHPKPRDDTLPYPLKSWNPGLGSGSVRPALLMTITTGAGARCRWGGLGLMGGVCTAYILHAPYVPLSPAPRCTLAAWRWLAGWGASCVSAAVPPLSGIWRAATAYCDQRQPRRPRSVISGQARCGPCCSKRIAASLQKSYFCQCVAHPEVHPAPFLKTSDVARRPLRTTPLLSTRSCDFQHMQEGPHRSARRSASITHSPPPPGSPSSDTMRSAPEKSSSSV